MAESVKRPSRPDSTSGVPPTIRIRACAIGIPPSATTWPVSVPCGVSFADRPPSPWAPRCSGRSNTPRARREWALGSCAITRDDRLSTDLEQSNVEDNGGVGWDDDSTRIVLHCVGAVSQAGCDDKPAGATTAHADHALLEPVNQRADSRREDERPPDIDGAVEFCAIEQIPGVVDRDGAAPRRPIPAPSITGDIA